MRFWLCMVLMVGCATPTIRTLAVTDAALSGCDAVQTNAASGGGAWSSHLREGDPVNGQTPSTTRIYGLMAVNFVFVSAIVIAPLPNWAKEISLGAIGIHVANTVNNNRAYVANCGF